MEINWNAVALVAGLMFYGMLAAMALRKMMKAAWDQLKALPRMAQALLAVMTVVATVQAQKPGNGGGTNEPPANAPAPGGGAPGAMPGMVRPAGLRIAERPNAVRPSTLHTGAGVPEPTVTAEEIAQGYRLDSETTEAGHSFAMPSNAVYIGRLHQHGARSDFGKHIVDLAGIGGEATGWAFPYGPSNATASAFWWFMDGRLQDALCGPVFAASASLGDVLAMQGESRLWAAAGGEARTVTWERFFAGGDTNDAVNAQIVMDASGDFTVRSNDLLRVFRRIDPHDWDGDGLDNLIDEWPTVSDGDCYGTGMDWLNANCSGVLSAVPTNDGGYEIVWNTNANANAYYWLTFTPTHDRTRIAVACDGPSNLGDMVVLANEGQVCDVPMLMGARYHVTASRPVEDIAASDPLAEVRLNTVQSLNLPPPGLRLLGSGGGGVGPSDGFDVERPVNLNIQGGEEGGRVTSNPDIGVVIGSITGNCCEVECSGSNYVWNCCDSCHCSGFSQWWHVTALWEGYSRSFDWEAQCSCQRVNETNTSAWVSLSAPSVIMRGGYSHYVSGVYNPPGSSNEEVSMSLQCTAGADKITILSQGSGWMEIRGAAVSDGIGDVEFRLVSEIAGQSYTNTANVTVACVTNLAMTCDYAGESANPPPFDGETACPFSLTNSLAPDRHLVVPFYRVATLGDDGFSVTNFKVQMSLVLAPTGVSGSSLPCDWEVIEAKPQMSGSLEHDGGIAASFVNPTQGGVYRFRGRCDGCPWTEGNVVLPLSGASIDLVFFSDMAAYSSLMAMLDMTPDAIKQSRDFGYEWFNDNAASDYIGRVDSQGYPTVWRYNQVSDDPVTIGMGAVAMWRGIPVRVAKLGNFLAGYGTKRLGIRETSRIQSQSIGTENDATANMSWQGGGDAFMSGDVVSVTGALATNMWPVADMKVKRLWPNPAACDNHVPDGQRFDYNFSFCSPRSVERGRGMAQQQGE